MPQPVTLDEVRDAVAWHRETYFDHDDMRWLLGAVDNVLTLAEMSDEASRAQILSCFTVRSVLDEPWTPGGAS